MTDDEQSWEDGPFPAEEGTRRPPPPSDLTVDSHRLGECWVVAVRGEVDLYSYRKVEAALDTVRGTSGELVLDLREVEFLDSSGLRLIFEERERARSGGYRFLVVRGPEGVQRLFDIAGLSSEKSLFVDSPAEICGP